MRFDRSPHLLIRIQFRTVGGQLFQLNDAMMFRPQKGVDGIIFFRFFQSQFIEGLSGGVKG